MEAESEDITGIEVFYPDESTMEAESEDITGIEVFYPDESTMEAESEDIDSEVFIPDKVIEIDSESEVEDDDPSGSDSSFKDSASTNDSSDNDSSDREYTKKQKKSKVVKRKKRLSPAASKRTSSQPSSSSGSQIGKKCGYSKGTSTNGRLSGVVYSFKKKSLGKKRRGFQGFHVAGSSAKEYFPRHDTATGFTYRGIEYPWVPSHKLPELEHTPPLGTRKFFHHIFLIVSVSTFL